MLLSFLVVAISCLGMPPYSFFIVRIARGLTAPHGQWLTS